MSSQRGLAAAQAVRDEGAFGAGPWRDVVTKCYASGPRGCADLALMRALGVDGMEMM